MIIHFEEMTITLFPKGKNFCLTKIRLKFSSLQIFNLTKSVAIFAIKFSNFRSCALCDVFDVHVSHGTVKHSHSYFYIGVFHLKGGRCGFSHAKGVFLDSMTRPNRGFSLPFLESLTPSRFERRDLDFSPLKV